MVRPDHSLLTFQLTGGSIMAVWYETRAEHGDA